jgi:type I restriction enzyme R subunit
MSPTDLSEISLELQIMADLTGIEPEVIRAAGNQIAETIPAPYDTDWTIGYANDFDRALGIDTRQLFDFLEATQPKVVAELGIGIPGNARQNFLQRLADAILSKGVLTVLRGGLKHYQHTVQLYYPLPTPGNETAAARFRQNRFSVTRQLRYSTEETQRALDLVLFINGLPIIELKNTITSQTVSDAIQQYKTTRKPAERLFRYGVCLAHFALDDQEAHFTTRLDGNHTRSCPSTRATTTARATRPTQTAFALPGSGSRHSSERASQTSSSRSSRWSNSKTPSRRRRSERSSFLATINSMSSANWSATLPPADRATAT